MKCFVQFSVAALLLCLSVSAQTSKEKAPILKVMTDQAAAWNRGDIEAFMSIGYWRSDKLMFVSGNNVTYGWQQTLDRYKKSYPDLAAMGKLTFSDLEINVISRDAAFVVGSWALVREKDNPKGKFTLLFRKFREGWRIVVDHTS